METMEHFGKRVAVALLLVTLVGTAIACCVLAPEVFFLTFLAILLGVFLGNSASYLNRWLPFGYKTSLAALILSICAVAALGGYFLVSAIDSQIERASQQMQRSSDKLEEWLRERPYTRQVIANVPFLERLLDRQLSNRESNSATGANSTPNPSRQPITADESLPLEATSSSSNENVASSDRELQAPSPQANTTPQSPGGPSVLNQATQASGAILSFLSRMFSTTFGLLTSLLYIIFVGIFLAVDPALYRNGLVSLFNQRSQRPAGEIIDKIGHQLFRWLGGRMLAMAVTGLGTGLGLWVLGVPLAGSVGVITALLTFIPNVGAAIALLLACLMALSQGASTVLWVIGLYLLLQLVESNVLTPLIQQHQTSIPPALLLAFQLLMGILTGFLGLTVATPLLAAGMVIVDQTWRSRTNATGENSPRANDGSGLPKVDTQVGGQQHILQDRFGG